MATSRALACNSVALVARGGCHQLSPIVTVWFFCHLRTDELGVRPGTGTDPGFHRYPNGAIKTRVSPEGTDPKPDAPEDSSQARRASSTPVTSEMAVSAFCSWAVAPISAVKVMRACPFALCVLTPMTL